MQEEPILTQNEVFLKYFDISEVIMQYYTKKKTSNLDKYFIEIEQFLNLPLQNISDNKPLIIQSEEGFGRKTFLVKWIDYHQTNSKTNYPIQDIILPFFSTVSEKNSNYFYAIYRFLVQLREKLNVKQKVELLEDKLRKYFGYWLDVCTRKIQKQVIKQKISSESKIILVIDRVDRFIDPSMSKEANIAFWLPRILPEKVRVIITCDKNSESYAYFIKNKANILEISSDVEITNFIIKRNSEKEQFVEPEIKTKIMECFHSFNDNLKKDCKFVETFLTSLLPCPNFLIPQIGKREKGELNQILKTLDFAKLSKVNNVEELIDFILLIYEGKVTTIDKFQKLLIILSISHKGLTLPEIMLLVRIKQEEWEFFIAVFKGFIIEFKGLYCIFYCEFKSRVFKRYQKDITYINSLHEEISEVLEKSSISIRKLEEQTFHLYISKSYFKLKETVSIIENFLLLFNPNNKFDLCHYWQTLLENGFDPALEYNKAIEGFEMHYKPSFEDIFRIILQVSRFLKEFSDFETENTALFRHPPITGSKELDDIGLMTEVKIVNMFKYPDLRRTHSILSNLEGLNIAKEASHEEFRKYYIDKMKQKMASEQMFGSEMSDQIQKFEGIQNNPIKSSMKSIKSLILDEPIHKKNDIINDSESSASEDSHYENDNMTEYRYLRDSLMKGIDINTKDAKEGSIIDENINSKNINSTSNILKKDDKKEQSDDKKGNAPCYYYYKRWLWMIFPWACLSQDKKCNYSEQIIKSYSSATKYISVLEENKYTKRALKIALEAKLKKKMIYGKKEEIDEEMNTLKNMKKEMRILELMDHHDDFNQNNTTDDPNNHKNKRTAKLDPLNETERNSHLSKALAKNNSNNNKDKNGSHFFLTEDPTQKGVNSVNKTGKSKMSFMKEKYSVYNEGTQLLGGLSIEEKSLRILPKLKDSITNHNKGALKVIEDEIKQLKNEYDNLVFSNKLMEKKLKEMKFIEFNNNLFGTEKDDFNVGRLREKVETLDNKLREKVEVFEETQNQKERINTILTICKRNKMQNEEYIRSLNYLLTNFKKSIRREHESIKKNKLKTKAIRQIMENLVSLIGDNLSNHSKLVNQIKNDLNQKAKFDASYNDTDAKILNSTMQNTKEKKSTQGQDDEKKKNPVEKNVKNVNDKLEFIKKQYESLSILFASGGENERDLLQSDRFQNFKTFLEKRSEIFQQNIEKQDKIDSLENILASKKSILANLKRSNEHQTSEENILMNKSLKLRDLQKNDYINLNAELNGDHESKCRDFIHLKQSSLNTLMILNTLIDKMGSTNSIEKLPKFDSEWFVKTLKDYMSDIKAKVSEEEYNRFEKMKIGTNIIYKIQADTLHVEVGSNKSIDLEDD